MSKRGMPEKPDPPKKLTFGIDSRCDVCKGSGKRPKRKELCGQCGGTGVFTREPPHERE